MTGNRLKILVADDHALFRAGVVQMLNELEDGTDIVQAGTIEDTVSVAAKHPDADLLLLDIYMPGSEDFSSLNSIRKQFPLLPVVVLSANNSNELIYHAFNLGCAGFIAKGESNEVTLSAIRIVLSGGSYFPPRAFRTGEQNRHGIQELTERQIKILALIGDGLPNKAIANELDISVNTVKSHVAAIFHALGVKNRTEAAQRAKESFSVG